MPAERAELRPIEADDAAAVASFLHANLNPGVPVGTWLTLLSPPWQVDAPNHGFQLVTPAGIVGAYVAVYSERELRGSPGASAISPPSASSPTSGPTASG